MTIRLNNQIVSGIAIDSGLADSQNPVANSAINEYLKNNIALTTDSKGVIGAINEVNANKVPRFTVMPTPTATLADGQVYQYIGVTTTIAPIYTHGYFYECLEVTPATTPATYEWKQVVGGSGGGGTWGSITGTLSDQTDLQDALDAKQDLLVYSATEPTGTVEGRIWIDSEDEVNTIDYLGAITTTSGSLDMDFTKYRMLYIDIVNSGYNGSHVVLMETIPESSYHMFLCLAIYPTISPTNAIRYNIYVYRNKIKIGDYSATGFSFGTGLKIYGIK